MKLKLTLFTLCLSAISFAQISFTESHAALNIHHQTINSNYSSGTAVVDVDGDGLDDITLGSGLGDSLRFYHNTGAGFVQMTIPMAGMGHTKQIAWIDYDNDGDMDCYLANLIGVNQLWENTGGFTFTEVSAAAGLSQEETPSWAIDWGDYNRDGYLDLYVTANVQGTSMDTVFANHLYKNQGDGTFEEISVYAAVADSNKNPLATTFGDINNDMWPDIFTASDKFQGNTLLKNNGNGTFLDISVPANCNHQLEGMNGGMADANNDGYEDIYVTNGPAGNIFLLNNGDETFTEVAVSNGTAFYDESWGGIFLDVDNDSDKDLYVSGGLGDPAAHCAAMYENDGTGNFTEPSGIGMDGDTTRSYSNAYGDFNNDGFLDILVNNVGLEDFSTIWMNNGNGNNFFNVRLTGVISNSMAVGAVIEIYHSGTYQKRYRHCSNGFMNQNTSTEHFGLAGDTIIDSVVVSWPSGLVENYYNLSANQTVEWVEGAQEPLFAQVFLEGEMIVCADEHVVLYPNGQFENIIWNNSISSRTIEIAATGTYFFQATNPSGGILYSDTVHVIVNDAPVSSVSLTDVLCYNDASGTATSTTPLSEGIVAYEWSNGSTNNTVSNLGAGNYTLVETNVNGCTDTVTFSVYQPSELTMSSATVNVDCANDSTGQISVTVNGGVSGYSYNWSNGATSSSITNISGGSYSVTIQDSNGCELMESYTITEPTLIVPTEIVVDEVVGNDGSIDLSVVGGVPPYDFLWSNAMTSEDLSGVTSGTYDVVITDSTGCSVEGSYVIESFVGIGTVENDVATITPNPSNGHFTVQLMENSDVKYWSITDISGREVRRGEIENSIFEINLKQAPSGVYYLTVFTTRGGQTQKIIKR